MKYRVKEPHICVVRNLCDYKYYNLMRNNIFSAISQNRLGLNADVLHETTETFFSVNVWKANSLMFLLKETT